jgi:DNA polymerase
MVWKAYDAAAREALTDRDIHRAGRCLFMRDGKHLICQLPSGREIVYRDARLEERTPLWALQRGLQFTQPTVVYTGSRGESVLYGGKITENVVQGLCRDLLAESLMKCEEAGLRPVLHVHDEIVCEVPIGQAESALAQLLTIMSTPPLWARAFPVGVEGYWNERYAKKPFGGRKPLEYFNGKPW